jgi:hypothetical protein
MCLKSGADYRTQWRNCILQKREKGLPRLLTLAGRSTQKTLTAQNAG